MDSSKQNIISLCTGMRGLEIGLERAGVNIHTVCYVEIEAFVCYNLAAQMEEGVLASTPIWTDAKSFPVQHFRGKVHGITGGYPCQPFSVSGQRKGQDDPRHLWPHFEIIVDTVRPVWCFFENVIGHLSLGYGDVYKSLRRLGYKVEQGIYSAEEVGATHQRKRLFILAYAEGSECELPGYVAYSCDDSRTISEEQIRKKVIETGRIGANVAHSNIIGCSNEQEGCEQIGSNSIRQLSPKEQTRNHKQRRTIKSAEDVAAASGQRSQRMQSGLVHRKWQGVSGSTTECGAQGWPARPGEPQHEWEQPRTIKPGLGFTVNGHNYREDLLRLAGNAVVPQTAEKAWIDLNKKIFMNAMFFH